MLDERVCPVCQVLLRDGTTVCVKCGRTVAPPESHLEFIEVPGQLYALLAGRLGPVGAVAVAAAVFLVLFLLWVASELFGSVPVP
jgi:hypothetical protein